MKMFTRFLTICFFLHACSISLVFGDEVISIKLEIERSLSKGVTWLNNEQNATSGSWGEADYPALTALALRSTMGHPDLSVVNQFSSNQKKGFSFFACLFIKDSASLTIISDESPLNSSNFPCLLINGLRSKKLVTESQVSKPKT